MAFKPTPHQLGFLRAIDRWRCGVSVEYEGYRATLILKPAPSSLIYAELPAGADWDELCRDLCDREYVTRCDSGPELTPMRFKTATGIEVVVSVTRENPRCMGIVLGNGGTVWGFREPDDAYWLTAKGLELIDDYTVQDKPNELADDRGDGRAHVNEDSDRRSLPRNGLRVAQEELKVYWRDTPLAINAHADFKVLKRLCDSFGEIVPYLELLRTLKSDVMIVDTIAKTGAAPEEVKHAVYHIRNAFKTAGADIEIKSIRRAGYRLKPHE